MVVNPCTNDLAPYPMEELTRIRQNLVKNGKPVYDFGTGDPRIPTWAPIREAVLNAIPTISQYPSVRGSEALRQAQMGYLQRRFGINPDPSWSVIPSQGSKEAVFNIGLCLIGRANGKKHLIYPDPGYPVYKSSAIFSGGIPYPVRLSASNGWLLEPWDLPRSVQESAAAIWVNYPHNPTGAMAPRSYFERLVEWAHKTDTIILSDDCYVDIYDTKFDNTTSANTDLRPGTPLQLTADRVLSFMSLSKRSGMTGYRSGFIAGDRKIIDKIANARANFGVGSPDFVQAGAIVAWNDDQHVDERRKIFAKRMNTFAPVLKELGMIHEIPPATFYLWAKIPARFGDDDVKCVLSLAELGVISSPSQWLSEGIRGYVRFALVPEDAKMIEALSIIRKFAEG